MNNLNIFQTFAHKDKSKRGTGINAVIYTRVSHCSQEENTSLESQKKYCEQFAVRKGYNIVGYFGGTYESAKTDDRKEFNRMLSFVKKSKNVNYILVYSYERFSRSGVSGAKIADDLLEKYKVVTLAVSQELDPTTPIGSFQQKMLFLYGHLDNEIRKDKSVNGMKEVIEKGYFPWNPPVGFSNTNKGRAKDQKIIVNEQGKLLRKAFEWKGYDQMSNADISRKLNTLGLKMNQKTLSYVFANPFYCGIITSSLVPDKVYEGKHEKLVSRELFLKVNNIIVDNRNHPVSHNLNDTNLPLKRFMCCATCHTPMTGYLVRKKNLYYYKCRINGCSNTKNAKSTHELFKTILSVYEINKDHIELIKEGLSIVFKSVFSGQIEIQKQVKTQITEIEQKLDTIQERFAIGEINRELFDKFYSKYTLEKNKLLVDLERTSLGKSSNLKKCIYFVTEICINPLKIWESATIDQQMKLQNLIFPEGIEYDPQNGAVLTKRVNSIFKLIPDIAKIADKLKIKKVANFGDLSYLVTPAGF